MADVLLQPTWRADFAWAQRLAPDIQAVIGRQLPSLDLHQVNVASQFADLHEATDYQLVFISTTGVRIAARIRSYGFLQRFPGQITIRYSRPSGAITEAQKIMDGWGDFVLYGFASPGRDRLVAYFIGDLRVLRAEARRRGGIELLGTHIENPDRTTFIAIEAHTIPGFVVVGEDRLPDPRQPRLSVDPFRAIP